MRIKTLLSVVGICIFSYTMAQDGSNIKYYDADKKIGDKTMKEHLDHVRAVLQTLRKESLYANMKKCTFGVDKLVFLGFVVSSKGVHVDESKINAIKTWPQPINLHQVRSFLGLAGFYHLFVKDFSTIASPLHALSKKNAPFLNRLKKTFPEIPIERQDERFTSKMAFQTMIDGGLKKKQRRNKALIDEISATIILQAYLNRH